MSAKERIEKSLRLEKVVENTVTLEWWGMYKYEFAGLDYRNAMFNDGQVIAEIWGDINPVIADLKDIKISGLAIEENRKNFKLDAVEIIKKLGDSVCLFGNVDSVNTIMSGNMCDIRKEIDKQSKARKYGNFIFQNGSPIAPGTSKENILEMVNYARRV